MLEVPVAHSTRARQKLRLSIENQRRHLIPNSPTPSPRLEPLSAPLALRTSGTKLSLPQFKRASSVSDSSPRKSDKNAQGSWTPQEEEALVSIMRPMVSEGTFRTERKWFLASEQMKERGFNRNPGGCRMVWCRSLRARTGIDERYRAKVRRLVTGIESVRKQRKEKKQAVQQKMQ